MARFTTSPTLFDDVKTISLTSLKQLGFLSEGCRNVGTLTWTYGDGTVHSASVTVDLSGREQFVELSYRTRGKQVAYRVNLEKRKSNLGAGTYYYFVCPVTGKRCRKLYHVGNYFLHREAFSGCMYSEQAYSKEFRNTKRALDNALAPAERWRKIQQPYFKPYYNGRPTRTLWKILHNGSLKGWKEYISA